MWVRLYYLLKIDEKLRKDNMDQTVLSFLNFLLYIPRLKTA